MERLLWGKQMRVKASGEIVQVQGWLRGKELKIWLEGNWYDPEAFEEVKGG